MSNRASSSKRKASDSVEEKVTTKKAKVAEPLPNAQPTNKVLPVNIAFPREWLSLKREQL
jgi:hypothetical protein